MYGSVQGSSGMGDAVRYVRQGHGLTQVELAQQLGVSQRWLSELETGRPKVLGDQLFDVLAKLGISLKWETPTIDKPSLIEPPSAGSVRQ